MSNEAKPTQLLDNLDRCIVAPAGALTERTQSYSGPPLLLTSLPVASVAFARSLI
jgi:hypothetical protein